MANRRRGLPRVPGGEPWPAAGTVASDATRVAVDVDEDATTAAAVTIAAAEDARPTQTTAASRTRSGLPRVVGGPPWPRGGTVARALEVSTLETSAHNAEAPEATSAHGAGVHEARLYDADTVTAARKDAGVAAASETLATACLRSGLPRVAGGPPWPRGGTVARALVDSVGPEASQPQAPTRSVVQANPAPSPAPAASELATEREPATLPPMEVTVALAAAPPPATSAPVSVSTPTPARTAAAASAQPPPARTWRGRSAVQWIRWGSLRGLGLLAAAAILVLAARGVTTLPGVPEFLRRYPGEYAPPAFVTAGFPVWVRIAHFLNFFLMVLIIRSGMLVRHRRKPAAFFVANRGERKLPVYLWLHLTLDVVWLLNGIIFIVLLFATGYWARLVPTSWEVFPNALSAMLQYLALNWPPEHSWVTFNSLQQLMYFLVVFVAAPLAAATGIRMSPLWPQRAQRLSARYPVEVARAIHYPLMLGFVGFILVHVFLVFTTGALRNLNHMFTGTDNVDWFGFALFVGALALTAAAWIAARPLFLGPLARVTGGRLSER